MQPTTQDIDIFRKIQKSPIFFIKKMWGLIPQPIIPGYEQIVQAMIDNDKSQEITEQYFCPFIKGKHITWQQWLILIAVERAISGKASKRISVVSGHGTGKSATSSWLILWYLFSHKNAQVPCTAPTGEQMHDILWKELKLWIDRMPEAIAAKYDWTTGYLRINESPETWFARAKTARKEKPEALAGVHGDYVFFVIDEGSGVPEEIFNTAEGALTGPNVLVLMISNGTRNEGYFYESHHRDRASWQNLSFNSEKSPIVDKEFVQRVVDKFGMDSDEYLIRVKGGFPKVGTMDDRGYVPLIDREQIKVDSTIPFVGRVRLGVDPAGEGDDKTIWAGRDNFTSKRLASEPKSDSKSIASKTLTLIDIFKIKGFDITVDNFGEGANVSRELAIAEERVLVEAVNWAEEAEENDIYINKRAECYFRLRDWLLAGGTVENNQIADEIAKIKYKRSLNGKKQIMPKPEMKKEMGGKSPDDADALALTFYNSTGNVLHTINQPTHENIHSPI